MKIELTPIEMEPSEINNPDKYKKANVLYLINDGVSFIIAFKTKDEIVSTLFVPNKIVTDSIIEDTISKKENEFVSKIDELSIKIDKILLNIQNKQNNSQQNSINLSDIARIVAVSQQPELFKV